MQKLTQREHEIIFLIAKGLSTKQISKNLKIAISTVETHRKNIRKKLNIRGSGKLLHYAIMSSIKNDTK